MKNLYVGNLSDSTTPYPVRSTWQGRERYANRRGMLLRGRNWVEACNSSHVTNLPLVGQPI
jgi:hypothetical protein